MEVLIVLVALCFPGALTAAIVAWVIAANANHKADRLSARVAALEYAQSRRHPPEPVTEPASAPQLPVFGGPPVSQPAPASGPAASAAVGTGPPAAPVHARGSAPHAAEPPHSVPPVHAVSLPRPSATAPSHLVVPLPASRPATDWEALLGGKWALWVGVALVFLAASFGLAYGWEHIPPSERVAGGIALGLVFLGAGEWWRSRRPEWFAATLSGGGLGVLYLALWAASARYGLVATETAFAAMCVVTASGVALALRSSVPSLMLMAVLGGYLTPVLLRSGFGEDGVSSFWTYLTMLNAGVLAVSLVRHWQGLNMLALSATSLLMGAWLALHAPLDRDSALTAFAFLSLNYVMFAAAGCAYPLRMRVPCGPSDLAFVCGSGAAYMVAALCVLPGEQGAARGAVAAGLCAVYLAVALVARGRKPVDEGLVATALGLSVGFATLAVPLVLRGPALAMLWCIEAAAVGRAAASLSSRELRWGSLCTWTLGLSWSVWADLQGPTGFDYPVVNPRGALFAVLILATMYLAHLERWRAGWCDGGEADTGALAVTGGLAWLWFGAREMIGAFGQYGWYGGDNMAVAAATVGLLGPMALALAGWGRVGRQPALSAFAEGLVPAAAAAGAVVGMACVANGWIPFANPRFGAGAVLFLCLVAITVSRRARQAVPTPNPMLTVCAALAATATLSIEVIASAHWGVLGSPATWGATAAGRMITLWAAVSAVCLLLSFHWRMSALRALAVILWAVAGLAALVTPTPIDDRAWAPFLNARALGFAALIALSWWAAALYADRSEELETSEGGTPWPGLFGAMAALLGLWALTAEVFHLFRWSAYPSATTWPHAAHLAVSIVWAVYAGAWMAVGIDRDIPLARWLALSLLGLALSKLIVYDLEFLSLPFRMVSFAVLGLILIRVAWLYTHREGQQRPRAGSV